MVLALIKMLSYLKGLWTCKYHECLFDETTLKTLKISKVPIKTIEILTITLLAPMHHEQI